MRTLVAILALSSAVAHAQTAAPAQPESTPSTPVLQSSLTQPANPAHLHAAASSALTAAPIRISTGVKAPALLNAIHSVQYLNQFGPALPATPRKVVVAFTVNPQGVPVNPTVITSCDPFTDRVVLEAVKDLRYAPGTLNGTPIAVPVELTWHIQPNQ